MRVILLVVVLSLLSAVAESVESRRKTGTPEEMQEAQRIRRMDGTFPSMNGMPPPPGFGPPDFNRQPGFNGPGSNGPAGVNGFPPGFNPGQPGFNGEGPNGMMNAQRMNDQGRTGPMDGGNGMPPPGFNGQQGGPNGQPLPPGFNGQQGMPPPGFNGQQGGPPGMVDANGAPVDPRLRAHEQMKQQVRQRSNAYLQRMDTMPNLPDDVKSTMREDIEELYKVEAGIY